MTRFAHWRLHGDLLAWGTWVAATVPAHPHLAVAYAAAAANAWGDGRLQEARDLARRGVEVGGGPAAPAAVAALAAPGDPAGLAIATANQALTLAYAGDDQAARPAAEEALAAARASANPTAIAMARFAEGEAFADADPARAAARTFEEAADDAMRLLTSAPGGRPGGSAPQPSSILPRRNQVSSSPLPLTWTGPRRSKR